MSLEIKLELKFYNQKSQYAIHDAAQKFTVNAAMLLQLTRLRSNHLCIVTLVRQNLVGHYIIWRYQQSRLRHANGVNGVWATLK